MELTIGVDVGGTKIAAGVVDTRGRIVDRLRVATPTEVLDLDTAIVDAIRTLADQAGLGRDDLAVGVAAAGFIDERRTKVRFAPNISWRDHPLGSNLSARLGVPVTIENDANAAAWAEFRFGEHDERSAIADLVLVTVGTGLGGGIVLDSRLIRGAWGIAAELGHLRMVPEGRPCGCGQLGCWEQYASGTALLRSARALVSADPVAAAGLIAATGADPVAATASTLNPATLTGQMVTAAALAGDRAAIGLFADLGHWLGEGIAGVANVLDPAVVVVGGGVADAGDLLLEPARTAFAAALSGGDNRPHLQIRGARLGNDAGMIGAADLARRP